MMYNRGVKTVLPIQYLLYRKVIDFVKKYYEILRDMREDHDLTQTQIAELLHTTQGVYSRYERGVREIPICCLITLCRYYNISADYILGLKDEISPLT